MKQLQAKARDQEHERDLAFHSYHGFEHTSSVLEIAIVLASASVKVGTSRLVVSSTGFIFRPFQAFWFFGPRGHWLPAMGTQIPRGFRLPPNFIDGRVHLVIVESGTMSRTAVA